MVRSLVLCSAVVAFAAIAVTQTASAEEKKPLPIKKIMAKAMTKKGILPKVMKGTASDAEKTELVSLMEQLAKNEAPRGDADSWKAKTAALVSAAKTAQNGSAAALGKASKCGACHGVHKPPKN